MVGTQGRTERNPRKLKEVLAACPELEFVIDGTERAIARLQDNGKRNQHYSRKKNDYGTTPRGESEVFE
jgi:hypothetical protein